MIVLRDVNKINVDVDGMFRLLAPWNINSLIAATY